MAARIRADAIDCLFEYGRESFDHRGHAVIVSGDKDFYQLIGPNIVLLNPGRGGPAAIDEHWVDQANASERLGDYQYDRMTGEDRATLRISSQHMANWLLHGLCTEAQVMDSLRRMAAKVDAQNAELKLEKERSEMSPRTRLAVAAGLAMPPARWPAFSPETAGSSSAAWARSENKPAHPAGRRNTC